jgi:hypothetical protein
MWRPPNGGRSRLCRGRRARGAPRAAPPRLPAGSADGVETGPCPCTCPPPEGASRQAPGPGTPALVAAVRIGADDLDPGPVGGIPCSGHLPHSARMPCCSARLANSWAVRVLPMPGSPTSMIMRPRPERASSRAALRSAISSFRPTKTSPVLDGIIPPC